jgi:hypothetical protein
MGGQVFAGFDTADYPGDGRMKSLKANSDLRWCGFYLDNSTWQGRYHLLKSMGWGVAPIHFGANPGGEATAGKSLADRTALGITHGKSAVAKAGRSTIPKGTIIYLDVEIPNTVDDWIEYFLSWCRPVIDAGYSPGCYCGYIFVRWLNAKLMKRSGFNTALPDFWAVDIRKANPSGVKSNLVASGSAKPPFNPDPPSQCGAGSDASSWQYAQNYNISWPGGALRVDLCSSIYSDPGQGVMSLVR